MEIKFKRVLSPNFFVVSKSYYQNFDRGIIIFDHNIIKVYVEPEELEKKAEEKIKDFTQDLSRFEKERDEIILLYDEVERWARGLRRKGFEDLTDDEVTGILIETKNWFEKIGKSICIFPLPLEERFSRHLMEEKGISGSRYSGILAAISSPPEESLALKAEMELLKIACEIIENEELRKRIMEVVSERLEKFPYGSYWLMRGYVVDAILGEIYKNEKIRKRIDEYVFHYGSIYYDYGNEELLDENLINGALINETGKRSELKFKVYQKLLGNIIEQNARIHLMIKGADKGRRERVFEKYLTDLSIPKDDIYYNYARMLSWGNFLRIKRRETLTQVDYYIAPLLKKVVIRFKEKYPESRIEISDVRFLELEDLISMSRGKKKDYREKVKNLREQWVWIKEGKKVEEYSGREAIKYIEKYGEETQLHKEIVGVIRYSPVEEREITGRARIILSHEQIETLRTGDILITLMVHPSFMMSPNYLKYINGCKAIVTEEGTLSCHLITLHNELAWSIKPEVPIITDARHVTDIVNDDDQVRIICVKEPPFDKVKIEVIK